MIKKFGYYSFAFILLLAYSCKKEKDVIPPANPSDAMYSQIGKPYLGGILAYVLTSNDPGYDPALPHGFIAAPTDQSPGIQWDSTYALTNAKGRDLGTGNANTTKIVDSVGAGSYAAKICDDLVLNGYSDWFLPSQYEILFLSGNQGKIGGFANAQYWASTEDTNYTAWVQGFGTGASLYSSYVPKQELHPVRAIRSF